MKTNQLLLPFVPYSRVHGKNFLFTPCQLLLCQSLYFQRPSETSVRSRRNLLEICAYFISWTMCQYDCQQFWTCITHVQPWLISAKHIVSSLTNCFTCVIFCPVKHYNSYWFLWYTMSDTKCCQDVVCSTRLILHFTHSALSFAVACLCVLTLHMCMAFFACIGDLTRCNDLPGQITTHSFYWFLYSWSRSKKINQTRKLNTFQTWTL